MKSPSSVLRMAILTVVVGTLCVSTSYGQKGGKGGGNSGGPGGGGGGTAVPYTLVDLKGFAVTYSGGTLVQSNAAAVNEPDGTGTVQIVGSSIYQLGNNTDYKIHPVLWEVKSNASSEMIDLGLPPEAYQAYSHDINDLGVITIRVGATSDWTMASWVSVPGNPLQLLSDSGFGARLRVNNFGEIVAPGALWQLTDGIPGPPLQLNGLKAAGIADTGLMAGHDGNNYDFGENPWKDYGTNGVPTLGWFDSDALLHVEPIPQPPELDLPEGFLRQGSATALSPNGVWVAGWLDMGGAAQAFVWSKATGMVLLQRLAGSDCMAVDVNNDGHVVGWSDSGDRTNPVTACLWQGGQVYELNVLAGASGSTNLETACSINNAGHVAGYMDLKAKGGTERHAYVLVPNN